MASRALPGTLSPGKAAPKAGGSRLPGISVIIPAHNEQATIARTLKAILAQRYPKLEVLLLADSCTDNTIPLAQAIARQQDRRRSSPAARGRPAFRPAAGVPRLRVLPNPRRLGLAGSLNRGISLSRYPLVCTLHADCVPAGKHWLRGLATTLLADPRCAATATAQLVPRSVFDQLTLPEKLLTIGSVEGFAKPKLPAVGAEARTVNNKGDLYRKSALRSVGGFGSARFRAAGEDKDLSLRLRKHWRLRLAPGLLWHLEGSHSRGPHAFFMKQLQYSEARGAVKRIYGPADPSSALPMLAKLGLYALLLTPLAPAAAAAILALTAYRAGLLRPLLTAEELALFFPVRILGDLCNILGFVRGWLTGRQQW